MKRCRSQVLAARTPLRVTTHVNERLVCCMAWTLLRVYGSALAFTILVPSALPGLLLYMYS